jgi:hypothetical protein
MQTNPNIILSGNQMAAPQLPDVNAMMQTRTAGMENIYNIEQQRAAQAQAAQKEQAAAQEAATIKALLPAYTYGIQTGDMAGAGNLVPPEIRPQVQQYIDALTGKSPEEVKSALIGSLSSLGQTGQEALAAIQRAETTGIQRGQLDVSRQRLEFEQAEAGRPPQMTPYQEAQLALEREKLAAGEAAANQPKVAFRETDAEGNVRMYDAAGNEIGMLPKAGKPTAPAGGGATEAKLRQSAKEADIAITELGKVAAPGGLIDMSTGSIVGNWLDNIVAQGSGGFMVLPGDVASAQMEVVAHLARMAVPRFEGPQSEYDAKLYERASGQLADPNTPTQTKRAAAQTLIAMLRTRRDQFAFSGSDDRGVLPADSGALQYDADGNLIE